MKKKRGSDFNPFQAFQPIHTSGKRQEKRPLSTKTRLILGTALCMILLIITVVLGQYIDPVHSVLSSIVQPIQKAYLTTAEWISDRIESVKTMQELQAENERLKEELDALLYQNTTLENDLTQLRELQELWELNNYYEAYPKTAAQIISRSPNNWNEVFVIDKGAADGLKKYMPILAGTGLVGHITQVFDGDARVTTIAEKSSIIYGQINRYGGGSYLQVRGAEGMSDLPDLYNTTALCYADFDPSETDIQVGDEVVTSALGDIYPPGILIGTVVEISVLDDGSESRRAYIQPAVDLEHLNYVLIITDLWKEDLMAKPEGDSQ